MTAATTSNPARGMKVLDLYRWGYQNHRGISFATNVIQCHMSRKAEKMRGLYNLVANGHDIGHGNTIDQISIDGRIVAIGELEKYTDGADQQRYAVAVGWPGSFDADQRLRGN